MKTNGSHSAPPGIVPPGHLIQPEILHPNPTASPDLVDLTIDPHTNKDVPMNTSSLSSNDGINSSLRNPGLAPVPGPRLAPSGAGATVLRGDGFPVTLGALPQAKAPAPPADFAHDPKARMLIARRPSLRQRSDARAAAAELSSFTSHDKVFGEDQAPLAASLERASAWNDHLEAARAWLRYVELQSDRAWDDALAGTNAVRASLAYWSERDPSVVQALPALVRIASDGGERAKLAKRVRATRVGRVNAKAKAAKGGDGPTE